MNIWDFDILKHLAEEKFINQRTLSETTGFSVGKVNQSLRDLISEGLLNNDMELTDKARGLLERTQPQRAIILAAGFGIRMMPVNMMLPKALMTAHGETLIERIIKQLNEAGIKEIYVVAGYMKEALDFLVDQYGVELIINTEYATKNNLHSLALASKRLSNAYVVPCDIWFGKNPFNKHELYSWYMVSDMVDDDSTVRVNRKRELISVPEFSGGNAMIGLAYISADDAAVLADKLHEMDAAARNRNLFWEEALFSGCFERVYAHLTSSVDTFEIDTFEQLKDLDEQSSSLNSDVLDLIAAQLHTDKSYITNIEVLKKGMTNRSFRFTCGSDRYIMRVPGEGTDMLIDRRKEYDVYQVISGSRICDDLVYINPDNGYKITKFIENASVCDPGNPEEAKQCMSFLRSMHERNFRVDHFFDIFERIEFYESLRGSTPSVYRDYIQTKQNVNKLKEYIESQPKACTLTHIDAVPDNFLFYEENGRKEIRMIDWEYASMQDPHVDIAMFAIYSMYEREDVDRLIDFYFDDSCEKGIRHKIYCYIAACGLLWSNWCEFKLMQGVDFGEYSLRQYRYAKEYYKILMNEWRNEMDGKGV